MRRAPAQQPVAASWAVKAEERIRALERNQVQIAQTFQLVLKALGGGAAPADSDDGGGSKGKKRSSGTRSTPSSASREATRRG